MPTVIAPSDPETVSQFEKAVIPGKPNPVSSTGQACGARPGIQETGKIQIILDPGSHPALRDLAGMTNYDTAFPSRGGLFATRADFLPMTVFFPRLLYF
jgi:hypothetical protein